MKIKKIFWLVFLLPVIVHAQLRDSLTVYFKFNQFTLEPVYENSIDSFITKRSISKIFIEGYCDAIGSDAFNDVLSSKRAQTIKNIFLSHNINDSLIRLKPMGKRFPLNGNLNADEQRQNRRGKIIVIMNLPEARPNATELPSAEDQDIVTLNDSQISGIREAEVGETIKLENINFYGGSHRWLPRSEKTLMQLYNSLRENPALKIEIQGHICCISSGDGLDFDDGGQSQLSVNRAKAVYTYLVEKGIDKSRLSYRGFGADKKLFKEERTETERESNRRVEIKIISK